MDECTRVGCNCIDLEERKVQVEHRCAVHVNEWCGVRGVKRVVWSAWCEGSDWGKEWLLSRIPGEGSLKS